ncbi:MAG: hypothetical protein EHM26_07235 [Desulfobacteraceae bacterium]|nr:MAG: hypothetical protein EHM26_07235 [Desulfobacteraceae bacterium]
MTRTIGLILGIVGLLWSPTAQAAEFKFPSVNGWKQVGEIQTFNPGTLYEYINGGADLYLAYDFEELKVAEYQNSQKAAVTVDVYRHRTSTHAFGVYSQERVPGANFIDVGIQGYQERHALNFLSGNTYVKITSYDTGPEDQAVLLSFAKAVAGNLGEKGAFPSILAAFPAEGKVKNSEKFTARKFLGYPFLHSAFSAEYDLSGKNFRLFIIEGKDQAECRDMVEKYLAQLGMADKTVAEGQYTLSDAYHGEIDLHWRGARIWGILDLGDPGLRAKYIKLFEEELQKRK